jgi:restriction endonuclease S subunit
LVVLERLCCLWTTVRIDDRRHSSHNAPIPSCQYPSRNLKMNYLIRKILVFFFFLFLWIYVQQANYVLRRTGGVRPHISRSDVREINVWEGMVQLKEHIYWKSLMYMVQ